MTAIHHFDITASAGHAGHAIADQMRRAAQAMFTHRARARTDVAIDAQHSQDARQRGTDIRNQAMIREAAELRLLNARGTGTFGGMRPPA